MLDPSVKHFLYNENHATIDNFTMRVDIYC